jgi:hypothetical protein
MSVSRPMRNGVKWKEKIEWIWFAGSSRSVVDYVL